MDNAALAPEVGMVKHVKSVRFLASTERQIQLVRNATVIPVGAVMSAIPAICAKKDIAIRRVQNALVKEIGAA